MTTMLDDLHAVLAPLAAGGASYAMNTVSPLVYPFIVFTRVSETPNVSFQGASALKNARVQIDIYSRLVTEAQSIKAAVEVAMAAWATVNLPLSSQDSFESAVQAYRVSLDFSVWSTN